MGHLAIARAAQNQYQLEQIHFITAQQNPHKPSVLDARKRHQLVEIALQQELYFLPNDLELNRSAPSYSSETISSYQALCPDHDLYWLMGADAFSTLASWNNSAKFAEIDIIVYPRGNQATETPSFLSQDKVHFLEMPEIAISSSGIRDLVMNPPNDLEDKLKNLVPEGIKSFLTEYYK